MRYGPTFLISYRNGRNDGEELKFSLRSLHQNFYATSPVRVVLVGDQPSWYTGEHVSTAPHGEKYRDILKNVIVGLRHTYNDSVVYYADDDYFLLDPTDVVLLAAKGPMHQHVADAVAYHGAEYDYTMHLQATLDELEGNPLSLSFELHRPLPIRTEMGYALLTDLWRKYSPESEHPIIPFWRTVYGNHEIDIRGTDALLARDGKIGTVAELARGEKLGVPWISGSETLWRGRFRGMITKHFPEPSPWEAR